ncbi:MAG: hypothetical protein ACK57K_02655 [Chryseotalea sp.]
MRKCLHFFFLVALFFWAIPALAQEGDSHNRGTLEGQTNETTADSEILIKVNKPDSIATLVKPVAIKAKTSDKTTEKKTDDSSFNFLYYIIQRFKSSDIIED